jgi:putative heme-binding domain-containing protein
MLRFASGRLACIGACFLLASVAIAQSGPSALRQTPDYSPQLVSQLIEQARKNGDPHRGLIVFSSATSACISCHKVGRHGGTVGPELTAIVKDRTPQELVEAVLWPKRQVKPEYVAQLVIDGDGRTHQGYLVRQDDRQLVLRDPTKIENSELAFPLDEIETREIGTLMPDNLAASMKADQLADLLRFVLELGKPGGVPAAEMDSLLAHAQGHTHAPATFPFNRKPLHPEQWPNWRHPVNVHRLYDFYAKQADYFRGQNPTPPLLAEFPGLDGPEFGHWGTQEESTWADDRWNNTQLGSVQCGIFRGGDVLVPRGVCVRLGERGELSACFNPETLTYDAVWSGGFVKFSSVRHGFMHGVLMDGELQPRPAGAAPSQPFKYRGFYRQGDRVVFAYRIGDEELLDAPWVENGRFTRVVAPAEKHPLRHLLHDAPAQWSQVMETPIELGTASPYAIDTIRLPFDNPWKAMVFCGGHGFLSDGSALVCTIQGDVWRVEGFEYPSKTARWRRFASGLHHALGLVVHQDEIYVLGRDQITRLHDRNGDGEADYYECFSNAYETSPAGHDFICGLERDADGAFYLASGNQGLVRISPDGGKSEVVATGFRNPDGLAVLPDGTITLPCSEGEWTPASMVCAVRPRALHFGSTNDGADAAVTVPHFGYLGPKNGQPPELPFAYLPRGLDNSSGGQAVVTSDRWGPLAGQLLHFSFGSGSHFLVLRDEIAGQLQGAVVPLPGEFRSGVHRGRFNPADGQLYVSGMQGWVSRTPDDGCFQRVRYTGDEVQLPVGFHVHENGVAITFSASLDRRVAEDAASHFAQCWNYRYSAGYGSPEFSSRHPGMKGHDVLTIASAHVQPDGCTLFLQLPELQPVNQLHLRVQSAAGAPHDLFITVHRLGEPFTDLPNYQPSKKTIQPHPILADLAMAARSIPNPLREPLKNARPIAMETGSNLSFKTRSFSVRPGEPIALTLLNPDVVPHNWALAKPGTLDRVGDLANRLIADPDAVYRHYIPQTDDVLAYTDVVLPQEEFTIYFHAPPQPGRYPYLCTFPGHWKVMNGEMIVEPAKPAAPTP